MHGGIFRQIITMGTRETKCDIRDNEMLKRSLKDEKMKSKNP